MSRTVARSNRTLRPTLLATLTSVAGLAGSAIAGTAPPAFIWYSVDGSAVTTASIVGTLNANGTALYSASIDGPGQGWKITYTIVGDFRNNPQSSLNGLVVVKNNGDETRSFTCGIEIPICPSIENGSLLGGTAKITLVADGPGSVVCDGGPVANVVTDGNPVVTLFHCPFQLATTGSGTVSTNTIFGLPGPSLAGPRKVELLGARQKFKLSGKDTAIVQVTYLLKDANPASAPICPADLNGDGIVDGADLSLLIQSWGLTDYCPENLPADLNGDGTVDVLDLVLLREQWGACGDEGER